MFLEIVSPEATLFLGEVTSVTVPGVNGEFQMLNNHAAIVSTLAKGNVKIAGKRIVIADEVASKFNKINDSNVQLAISSGTVEMKNNKIIILID